MLEKHYLLKVLGISTVPRIVSFVATLISFPLMVRALGASGYGHFVYFTSVVMLFEPLLDCGISAATGKAIAAVRLRQPSGLRGELFQWMKWQAVVATTGFVLSMVVGYAVLMFIKEKQVPVALYVFVGLAAWTAIGNSLIRAALNSLLAFKHVALLDIVESILRSLSWLYVAFVAPTVTILALTGWLTGLATLLLGGILARKVLRAYPRTEAGDHGGPFFRLTNIGVRRDMIAESLRFLSLRFATRAFQSLPLILIKWLLGVEVVGIIGAFSRVVEMVSFPFVVIANALMVKAHEVQSRGLSAIREYWNVIARLCVAAVAATGGFFLVSEDVALIMAPGSSGAPHLFSIMSVWFLAMAVSGLFASASDYVGGLGKRVRFLALCASCQLPIIFWGATQYRDAGAAATLVASYALMVGGYAFIARGVFFGSESYRLPKDVPVAIAVIAGALLSSIMSTEYLIVFRDAVALSGHVKISLLNLGVYAAVLSALFLTIPRLRGLYLTLNFLDPQA